MVVGAGAKDSPGSTGVFCQIVNRTVFGDDLACKNPENLFIGDISDKIIVVQQVNGADRNAVCDKRVADCLANGPCPTVDNGDFRFVDGLISFLFDVVLLTQLW